MKKLVFVAALAAAGFHTVSAQAALLEFDVSGVQISATDSLSGSFVIDTATDAFSDISITGLSALGSVSYESSSLAGGVIIDDGTTSPYANIEIYLDPAVRTTLFEFNIIGLDLSSTFAFNVPTSFSVGSGLGNSTEIVAGVGSRAFLNSSTVSITRLDDPNPGPGPSAVPLPAGLPLLLAGLGAFGWMRRKKC